MKLQSGGEPADAQAVFAARPRQREAQAQYYNFCNNCRNCYNLRNNGGRNMVIKEEEPVFLQAKRAGAEAAKCYIYRNYRRL
jgi:hypothetical protein